MKRFLPFLFVLLCLAIFGVAQEPIPNFPAAGGRNGQVPYAGINGATWRYLTGSGNLFTNLYASALIVRNADTNAVFEWLILTNSAAKQIDFKSKDDEVLGRINENGFVGGGSQLSAVNAATVTVIDGTDSTSFVSIFDSATGNLPVKTDGGLLYNASSALLTVGAGGVTTAGPINAGSYTTAGNLSWDGVATGDGSGISALNASSLASGTANPARLATNSAFSNSWLRATSASTSEWSRDGSGLTNLPPPAPLQPQTRIYLKDEFASGNITSGSIGELGWVFDAIGSGGGVSQVSTTYGHPQMGVVRVYSTVNAAGETLSSGNSGYINSATNRSWRVTFVGNTDQTTAVRLYFGLGDGTTALQANGIGFRYDTTLGDTAWMAYVMSGGTQSATTTGVAVNTTAFPRFQIECNSAGTITYFIDGTQVATRTTGGPATTVFLRLQAQILSDGAVTRHWNFDYFAFTEASTR